MLQINMADVMNVIGSLTPYLIAIGVLFVLALIITFAVNKKTVKDVATRKIVHSESWLVALVGIVVAVSMMLTGPLSTLLNNATITKYTLSDATVSKANELAKDVQSEAVTLLKNDDSNLPLSGKKVNVFGWGSTNPVYGGTGSGSMSKQYKTVSLLDGMKQAGLKTNTELSKLYTDYRKDRPEVGMFAQDWTLPEVPAKQYSDKLVSDAKDFSDEAVVVLTRVGGEGADLPTDMKAKGITYKNNSKDYDDFQKGESFLQLSKTERDMIDLVTSNFKKVTLVYNGANTFQFDFLNDYPQIQSVVWCPPAGQTGFSALGEVLAGETNPSGKTSDTFLKNLTKSVSYNNFGKFEYTNMADKAAKYKGFTGDDVTAIPGFVNYSEGIYVGYKFYETASDEGLINYDDTVAFPFGYGLSYTSFDQKLDSVKYKGGKVTVTATVTNTGDKAGKDVVEVYYNPPYTDGGIEKASKNLAGFEKTKELQPGESQKVTVKFDDDDMASYDYKGAKAYVLEKGDYDISIQSDSHHVIDHKAITVKDTVTYDSDSNTHNGDKTVATNQFDDVAGDVTYLSRADHFANYKEATAAPTNFKMSDKVKEIFYNNSNYDPKKFDKDSDKMPTTGAKNGLKLSDMYGKDYDDADWDKLLDQLTFDDMDNLIANGGYGTQAVKSVGKIQLTDADGPASLNNNFTGVGSIGFPASTAFACTWNKDLAKQFGEMIGDMAHDMHVAGWYAPAMNIHRNAFSGRTFEYFSEDSLLSGVMASSEISGAKSKGVYSFMKHFALNDQETKRTEMLCTWTNEQAMREIYLKPFEMSVKEGGAQAVMSSFNYIGNTYAGADSALLQTVLRGEWGFKGFVLTDYFGGYGYQNADQEVRAGNDSMLATTKITNHITDKSATSVKAMRQAAHNILYTAANSWQYANGEPKVATPIWKTAMYVAWGVTAVLVIGLEFLTIKRYLSRKKAVATIEPAAEPAQAE
ncbi:glycoside hydrolase family 3 N-terminal domain-containing protein [Bifidobacterium adolescentis]|uniref:glycoside hydrolase family 3 protein n=1 Tax=Bifidobacterium adolescentis TaxID=1680 RepID=UPI00189FEB40|nr:glycoside hydrolase family 3 protein [Bifidobacterium adolescentis]MDB0585844.1 glycoside hydrolase family 3 N-terminal domain-containing protein [Bifidobacterium adolescentis]MDB0588353.1 glycoside hydrolase family 3 N-terminal domain-containing protein [Bifidobacterium adolescentis]MDB0616415.1 glycoside hydrolase family 3 N-terminal domain-containing protein [Bifidobacterium adolescentis]MDB0620744.1 glycoside hydrolase family 3 N-terminal domain-containing protein [Bifidobacterium adoles